MLAARSRNKEGSRPQHSKWWERVGTGDSGRAGVLGMAIFFLKSSMALK